MIRLRLLGGFSATTEDGRPVPLVGAKRIAVLAYIAAAKPIGMHRRDTLLPLFWPEHAEPEARRALRHTVYVLRRSLGAGAIVGGGADEIGLSPSEAWCDVSELESASRDSRDEDALALYSGDFLEGVRLSGSAELEQWLDTRQRQLRDIAVAAAWRLEVTMRMHGDMNAAMAAARRALEFRPADPSNVRRAMTALAELGAKEEALRVFEDFRLYAEEQLGQPAHAELLELSHAIRHAEVAAVPVVAPASIADGAARVTAPADSSGALTALQRRVRNFYRDAVAGRAKLAALSVLGLAACGAAVLGANMLLSMRSLPAAVARGTSVSILPFAIYGDSVPARLSRGLGDLLATRLDGVVGSSVAISRSNAGGERGLDLEQARRIAATEGAGWFVLASLTRSGRRTELDARVYRDTSVVASAMASGRADDLFALVDTLALNLIVDVEAHGRRGAAGESMPPTASLNAYRAFLSGERLVAAGRAAEAIEEYQRASHADTTFSLAAMRVAWLANCAGDSALARERWTWA